MHSRKQIRYTAAVIMAFVLMIILSVIQLPTTSAISTKYYSVGCEGGTIYYYNSSVTSISSNSNVSISCSNRGSYSIRVAANPSTSARTIKLTAMKSGSTAVEYISISQAGIPTRSYSMSCAGGTTAACNFTNAYSYYYSNTAVCSSRSSSGGFIIKPSTSTATRSCTVTVKNRSGNVVGYAYLTQSAVPTRSFTVNNLGGATAACNFSGAYSYTYSNTAVCSSRASNGGFNVKPNNTTSSRTCTVTAKNSAGNVVGYAYITQAAVPVKNITASSGNYCTVSYYNSSASSFDPKNTAMIYKITCSNPGNYSFSVSANPSTTASRTSDIYVKNSAGNYLEILRVTQPKYTAPTTSKSVDSKAQTISFFCANADKSKFVYSNTAVCNSCTVSGNTYSFQIKTNPTVSSRTETITLKDKNGTVLAYLKITQSAAPIKNVTASSGNYCTVSYGGASNYTFDVRNKSMIYNVSCTNPGSFLFHVSANPSTTASRTGDVFVKDSKGNYIQIVRITQPKRTVPTYEKKIDSKKQAVSVSVVGADKSKFVYSNTAMCNSCTASGNNYIFTVSTNPNAASRTETITIKDKNSLILAYVKITQSNAPVKAVTAASGSSCTVSYGGAASSSFDVRNKSMIYNVSCTNPGSFLFHLSTNPSTTASRTGDVFVKDSNGNYIQIVRITQPKYVPPTKPVSITARRQTVSVTYANADKSKFVYSNAAMCNSCTVSGNTYTFLVNANSSKSSRTETITIKDKNGVVLSYLKITQAGAISYTVGAGEGENISYYNKEAASFVLPTSNIIRSVRATNPGSFIFKQSFNHGTLTLTGTIKVLDSSKNVIEYIYVTMQPTKLEVTSSQKDIYDIHSVGKTIKLTLKTNNRVTVTLKNAKFSDGSTSKSFGSERVKPNDYNNISVDVIVDKWTNATANRDIIITTTNGLEKDVKKYTQLAKQVGFKGATEKYPLGTLGRDGYVYKIQTAVGVNWTKVESVKDKKIGFDFLGIFTHDLEECPNILTFALVNGQNIIYESVDNYFITADFYKDADDNRFVIILGSDSDTTRTFMNNPAQGVYHSDINIFYKKGKHTYTGYIDGDHAVSYNWVFWVDTDGKVKQSLRKFGKDSFKVDGIEVGYRIGYQYPNDGGTYIRPAYSVASDPIAVGGNYPELLKKLGK